MKKKAFQYLAPPTTDHPIACEKQNKQFSTKSKLLMKLDMEAEMDQCPKYGIRASLRRMKLTQMYEQ